MKEGVGINGKSLKDLINESGSVVFFGGAGVSTESGIPDFRSADGLYNQQYPYPPETMLSYSFFQRHTEEFFNFYRAKMLYLKALPSDAHKALAIMENQGKLAAIITQNIDGLHQKAGSKNVLELHGSVLRNYCVSCGRFYGVDFIAASKAVPRCGCGGVVKPDVVLYEERLDSSITRRSASAISGADMLIVGGTSLSVYPAAGLVQLYQGGKLILINKSATPLDRRADLVIHESIGKTLMGAI
ncbi:MAG: NAD-dependent protein deacylase [Clostridiales bacterium]|nr:NAD-dependent protein deacylase [Clostridiales bacterium]